jgi:hypothetical protein
MYSLKEIINGWGKGNLTGYGTSHKLLSKLLKIIGARLFIFLLRRIVIAISKTLLLL